MKLLVVFLGFAIFLPVFAQTEKSEENPATKEEAINAPEIQEQEAPDGRKPSNPFQLGPYKDGAYQFWGEEDLKERDEREEAGQ